MEKQPDLQKFLLLQTYVYISYFKLLYIPYNTLSSAAGYEKCEPTTNSKWGIKPRFYVMCSLELPGQVRVEFETHRWSGSWSQSCCQVYAYTPISYSFSPLSLALFLWKIDPITQRAVDFYNRTIKFTIVDRYYRKIVINCRRPKTGNGYFFLVSWRIPKVFSFVCDFLKSIIYILKSILLIAGIFLVFCIICRFHSVSFLPKFTIARWQRSDRPHKMRDNHCMITTYTLRSPKENPKKEGITYSIVIICRLKSTTACYMCMIS